MITETDNSENSTSNAILKSFLCNKKITNKVNTGSLKFIHPIYDVLISWLSDKDNIFGKLFPGNTEIHNRTYNQGTYIILFEVYHYLCICYKHYSQSDSQKQ